MILRDIGFCTSVDTVEDELDRDAFQNPAVPFLHSRLGITPMPRRGNSTHFPVCLVDARGLFYHEAASSPCDSLRCIGGSGRG